MKKAAVTGFFAGIIITCILIGCTYLRRYLPDTFTANLIFFVFFFGTLAGALWLSFEYYCKSAELKLLSLNISGIISCLIAACLVTLHGFMYSRFESSGYVDEIMKVSGPGVVNKINTGQIMVGEWTWFQSTGLYALYQFRDLAMALFMLSLIVTIVFYVRHKNRRPGSSHHNNQELIF